MNAGLVVELSVANVDVEGSQSDQNRKMLCL